MLIQLFYLESKTKAHLALLGTNVFFAINFTAIKYLFNGGFLQPFSLNFIRMLGTTILLWVLYFLQPKKEPIKKIHISRLLVCCLLGIVINQLLFIKGLSMTYSIHASLLMLTTPIFITIIAAWILKETLNAFKIIGLLLGVSGATLLILARKNTGSAINIVLGDIFIIINAICYSYYFVLVKPLMKRYDAITIIRNLFTIGTVIALPFCWKDFISTPWHLYSMNEFMVVVYVIVGGTFCAYLFNLYGIKHLGPSVSGTYIYSQPVFATIIAALILHETIDLYKIISAAFIFTGVYFSNKSSSNA